MTVLTRVDKKTLAKCTKLIMPLLEDPLQMASTADYVSRFCSNLDLPVTIRNAAEQVVQRATEWGLLAGKSPLSVAAAAIFLITQLSDSPKTERDISSAVGVTDTTIKNAYRDLWPRRHELVPKEFKMALPMDSLPVPLREIVDAKSV